MPRQKKERIVDKPPIYTGFKPMGFPAKLLKEIVLTIDEYESIRLADFMCLSQKEASEEMEISRSTFARLIESARKKMADFIINGKRMLVEGGNIHFRKNLIKCNDCDQMFIINIDNTYNECPQCKSKNFFNLANGFGHGSCCYKKNGS